MAIEKILGTDTGKSAFYKADRNFEKLENALNIKYDNSSSGMSSDNVQDVIDELKTRNDDLSSQVGTIETQTLVESYLDSRNISSLSKRGKLDVGLKGMTLYNELNYNPETWEEWDKTSGVIGDATGLTVTADGVNIITAKIYTNLKPSTKYGYIVNIVKNTVTTGTIPRFDNTGTVLPAFVPITSGFVGLKKSRQTTPSDLSAMNNKILFAIYSNTDSGQEIKMKDIRCYELPVGSEIETDFENMTADELNIKYPYVQGGNLQGVSNIEVRSVGKNLFDKDKVSYNTVPTWSAGIENHEEGSITSDFIIITPNRPYKISGVTCYIYFFDINKNYLGNSIDLRTGAGASYSYFTCPNDNRIKYIRLSNRYSGEDYINVIQLEEDTGQELGIYEPYKSTSNLYKTLDGEVITLHRLPNSVRDEKDINGKYIKKCEEYELKASDITEISNRANAQRVCVTLPSNSASTEDGSSNTLNGQTIIDNFSEQTYSNCETGNYNGNTYFTGTDNNIYFYFDLNTYPTLADAQKSVEEGGLAGLRIVYQFAEPQIIDTNEVPMIAEPNGHVFISSEGCLPSNIMSYPINLGAQVDGVVDVQKQHSELLKHQNVVNIEFDLRITALEP